jgi:hypothetical protein
MHDNNRNGVAWTALIVALLALILGWTAFNRAGADIGDIVEQEVREATQELEQRYQNLEADVRGNVSEDLNEAAQDASTDSDPNSAGE